jgi:hypothetical protein
MCRLVSCWRGGELLLRWVIRRNYGSWKGEGFGIASVQLTHDSSRMLPAYVFEPPIGTNQTCLYYNLTMLRLAHQGRSTYSYSRSLYVKSR